MPRPVLIPLPRFLVWLESIRNDTNVRNGVDLNYLLKWYNSTHDCDVTQRTFTRVVNKALNLVSYVRMDAVRVKGDRTHTRIYYFDPTASPTDIPYNSTTETRVTPAPLDMALNSNNRSISHSPNHHTTETTVNVTPTNQVIRTSEIPNQTESPLTLLNRAALSLQQDIDAVPLSPPTTPAPVPPAEPASFLIPPTPPTPSVVSPSFTPKALSYITLSNTLDFHTQPRPDPRYLPSNTNNKTGIISHIHSVSRLPSEMKLYMVMVGKGLGYDDLTHKQKTTLIHAILTTESYLEGYQEKMGSIRSYKRWYEKLKKKEIGSEDMQRITTMFRDHSGNCSVPFTTKLQQLFPELLHTLFRYAGNTHGYDANTSILVNSMNNKSKALYPNCEVRGKLKLSKYNFDRFFKENKGVVKEPTIKPRLSKEHKASRVVFCKRNKKRINRKKKRDRKYVKFHYCFIDEKWFYVFTKRKKNKYLPPALFEKLSEVFIPSRKIRSRRFVTKVMFMGIVAPPLITKMNLMAK
jgi:hypothetical protein